MSPDIDMYSRSQILFDIGQSFSMPTEQTSKQNSI